MFKNKIHSGPSGRQPLTKNVKLAAAYKPGTILVLSVAAGLLTATAAADMGPSSQGYVVLPEESPHSGILATAQNVGGLEVTYPINHFIEAYEVEAGLYFNLRVASATAIVEGLKYGTDGGLVVGLPGVPDGSEYLFLVADESSAAGADRLVRFRVVKG